jgi:hypothetical protein
MWKLYVYETILGWLAENFEDRRSQSVNLFPNGPSWPLMVFSAEASRPHSNAMDLRLCVTRRRGNLLSTPPKFMLGTWSRPRVMRSIDSIAVHC